MKLINGNPFMLKKTNIYQLLKLFYRGFGSYKIQIIILTVLSFLGGLLEGVGINAAIPLFSFASGSNQKANDAISKIIENFFGFLNVKFSLKYLLVFIVVLFLLRALVLIWCNYIKVKISSNYVEQTQDKLFSKTLKANWPFLLKQKLGHLQTILSINIQNSGGLLTQISAMIITFAGLLMYIVIAINISLIITVITICLGIILLFIFKPIIYRIKNLSKSLEDYNRQTSHFVNENILGMKTIKASMVDIKIAQIGKSYFLKMRELWLEVTFLRIVTDGFMQPIGLIFICIVFAISYKTNSFNFAALAAIIYLIQRMFIYFQQFQGSLQNMGESVPYLRKIIAYEDELAANLETNQGRKKFEFNQAIEFNGVIFAYSESKKILADVNFSINKGETVGLIGPSGAGKTTIVDLMLRLFKPSGGQILMDKKNIAEIEINDWRKNIGYVSQDIFLKNDTITNNIKFYDDLITMEDVERAVKMADIYDFVQTLPNGFETIIGERGIMLSAGQRQRIVIARVLAKNPQFLILDEATSALDNEAEAQIQKVVSNLKGKLTIFVIAHRLSTVINCDKLLVLENGIIIEQGVPKILLENKGSYFYKVYNLKR